MYIYETEKDEIKKLDFAVLANSLLDAQRNVFDEYILRVAKETLVSCNISKEYGLVDCKLNPSTFDIWVALNGPHGYMELNQDDFHKMLKGAASLVKFKVTEAGNDLKYVAYINSIGAFEEYCKDTYHDDIRDVLMDALAVKFLDNGLILPRQFREKAALEWYPKYRLERYNEYLAEFAGGIVSDTFYSRDIKFLNEMRNRLDNERDNDKVRELTHRIYKFIELYDGLTRKGRIDLMQYIKGASQIVYFVHAKNGDRIATAREKRDLVEGIYRKEVLYIPKDKRELLCYYVWACNGNANLIRKFSNLDEDTDLSSDGVWEILKDAIKYLRGPEFLEKDILEIQKGLKPLVYPRTATDEIVSADKENRLKKVYAEYKDKNDDYSKLVTDIARKALRRGVILSEKQLAIVNKAYERLITEKDQDRNKLDAELLEKINKMLSFYTYKKTDFEYKFMTEIVNKKFCTVKQRDLILDWYERYLDDIQRYRSGIEVDVIDVEGDTDNMFSAVPDAIEEDDNDLGIDIDIADMEFVFD